MWPVGVNRNCSLCYFNPVTLLIRGFELGEESRFDASALQAGVLSELCIMDHNKQFKKTICRQDKNIQSSDNNLNCSAVI